MEDLEAEEEATMKLDFGISCSYSEAEEEGIKNEFKLFSFDFEAVEEATMDAVKAAGCQNAADFLSALTSDVQAGHSQIATHRLLQNGFNTIVLVEDVRQTADFTAKLLYDASEILSGCWGLENALLFDLGKLAGSQDLQRLLRALAAIPPYTTLRLVGLWALEWTLDDCRALSDALSSSNFSSLLLDHCSFDSKGFFVLAFKRLNPLLQSLHIWHPLQTQWNEVEKGLVLSEYSNLMECNQSTLTALKAHRIQSFRESTESSWNAIMEGLVLPSLSSVTSLTLFQAPISASQVEHLFSSLEDNFHFASLSLLIISDFSFEEEKWSSTKIVDSLRRHGFLHNVKLRFSDPWNKYSWIKPLESDAAIDAQLRKNKENAACRVELLKSGITDPVRPSTLRLYLCGLPFSGKTTLCRSLAKCSKGSLYRWPWVLPLHKSHISLSKRTRGIEVTLIESPLEQIKISVWDMAGQLQYHSFHDSMLPDLNDRAAPPLFLYVWNPYKMLEDGKVARDERGHKTRMNPDQFRDDFNYWLKFIASKTPKSEAFKPKVMVVVTRADLGPRDVRQWLHTAFSRLQKQFQEHFCFDDEEFFQVDARDPQTVSRLASHLLECAKEILNQAPHELNVCVRAREAFRKLLCEKEIPPLITKEKFYILMYRHLGIESQEICEAVALSLSSTGDLIYFPSVELVVIDTQWFCQKIMGDLIYFNSETLRLGQQGFFPLQFLHNFFEKESMSSKSARKWHFSRTRGASNDQDQDFVKISGDAVVKLLMALRMACPRDYTQKDSDIFIPSSLCGNAREKILPSKYLKFDKMGSCTYIGRRWAVKDSSCTFLTPGIFSLVQVTFYNILSNRGILVNLNQDVMAFAFEGTRAFVEFCRLEGQDNFIDVLVVSLHTKDKALEWLHENVMVEMKKVFADSRGIPGVELIESVIQPVCIQGLVESGERKAVSIQDLQHSLMRHIQKNGIKFTDDGIGSVMYTWQTKYLVDDLVISLLGEVEVTKLVKSYRASLNEAASHVQVNLSTDIAHEEAESSRFRQHKLEFGSSQSHKQREAIYDKVCDLEKTIKVEFKQLAAKLEGLAHQVEDLRDTLLPKLHQMFSFLEEGEAGKLPRMYSVTDRLVSKMVNDLHYWRLELWCECRHEPCHRVDGQQGLSILTLEDGLLKRGLPYIDGFLRFAHAVAKVGAHVAVGYGDMIPDFTRVLSSIVDTEQFGPLPLLSTLADGPNSSSRLDVGEGQQWLFDVLSHHNCTKGAQIYKHFGLRRVRYARTRVVAWVCDKHYSGGEPFPA